MAVCGGGQAVFFKTPDHLMADPIGAEVGRRTGTKAGSGDRANRSRHFGKEEGKMTLKEAKKKIAEIESRKDDDESAHILEDGLYEEFILHVAECGDRSLKMMAKAVLKTKDIDFARWCS